MRKVKILGAAFIAVLAFAVVSVGSASANQWLKGGKAITAKELAVTEGKWTLEGSELFGGKIESECNGKLLGTVGPGAEDLVTEATDLNGNKQLSCSILSNTTPCSGTLVLVEAEQLPWKTELLEPNPMEFVDHFKSDGKGLPAFSVKCLLSGGSFTESLCEGEVLTDALKNVTGGVEGAVLKQAASACKGFGIKASTSAKGTTKLSLSTEALTVS